MANKEKGYVKIFRSVKENWIWESDEAFDRRSAWIDILLSVNHKKKKLQIDNQVIDIHPGQMWTSYMKLAQKWGWSRPKVHRYINLLKSDGMILVDATHRGTLLTVVNWADFNSRRNTNVTSDVTSGVTTPITPDVTPDVTQTRMIKNVNNVNNEKEIYGYAGLKFPSAEDIANNPPRGGGEWE